MVGSDLYILLIEFIFKPLRCNRTVKILFVYDNYNTHNLIVLYIKKIKKNETKKQEQKTG